MFFFLGCSENNQKKYLKYTSSKYSATLSNPNYVLCLAVDDTRGIIFWGGFTGLVEYNLQTGKSKRYYNRDGVPGSLYSLVIDKGSKYLYLGGNLGFGILDLETRKISKQLISSDARSNIINSLAFDGEGLLYAGTEHGLFRYINGKWYPFYDSHEFGVKRVMDISWSLKSGLWVAKENVISRYYNGKWSIFLKEVINPNRSIGLVSNNITSVATDSKGKVWIGTTLGLNSYDNGLWKTFLTRDALFKNDSSLLSDYIYTLAIDQRDRLWIGYGILGLGVSYFEDEKWYHSEIQSHLSSGYVFDITLSGKNKIWFATSSGINCYNENSNEWTTYKFVK